MTCQMGLCQALASAYSSIKTQDAFDRAEIAGSLELDLMGFVEWSEKWLVTFNATKTKLLPFNRHRCYDPWFHQYEWRAVRRE